MRTGPGLLATRDAVLLLDGDAAGRAAARRIAASTGLRISHVANLPDGKDPDDLDDDELTACIDTFFPF